MSSSEKKPADKVRALYNQLDRCRRKLQILETTFEEAPVGMAHLSPKGRFLRVNARLCEIMGYSRETLLASTFQEMTHPDDLERYHVRELLEGKLSTYTKEHGYVRQDGSAIWVDLTVSLIRNEQGTPAYFIAVLEEITQRKNVEDALRLRERAMEAVRSGIVIADAHRPGFPVTYSNKAFGRITGYSRHDVLGRGLHNLLRPGMDGDATDEIRDILQDGHLFRMELKSYHKGGQPFWSELWLSPVRNDQGTLTHVVGVLTPLSESRDDREEEADLSYVLVEEIVNNDNGNNHPLGATSML